MSTQITITLPDDIYQRAERFARLANRDIASVLADTIQHSIPPVSLDILDLQPVADLPDEEILALTELQMEPAQDARLSTLLDRQQANLNYRKRALRATIAHATLSREPVTQGNRP